MDENKLMRTEKQPLLTLAIPSYNRADKLDKQIEWAVHAIGDNWDKCELLIADNCSLDNTSDICSKWKIKLKNNIRIIKNEKNVGLIGNYLVCINNSQGKYLWAIGDDDPIDPTAVIRIIDIIVNDDISLIHLNHRCVWEDTLKVEYDNFYNLQHDIKNTDGKGLFEYLIARHMFGGFMFISANVGKTNLLKESIASFRNSPNQNLGFTVYAAAVLANKGTVYFSSHIYMDCMYGKSSWLKNAIWLYLVDIPVVFYKMKKLGYNQKLLNEQIYSVMNRYTWRQLFFYGRKIKASIIPKALLQMLKNKVFLKRIL